MHNPEWDQRLNVWRIATLKPQYIEIDVNYKQLWIWSTNHCHQLHQSDRWSSCPTTVSNWSQLVITIVTQVMTTIDNQLGLWPFSSINSVSNHANKLYWQRKSEKTPFRFYILSCSDCQINISDIYYERRRTMLNSLEQLNSQKQRPSRTCIACLIPPISRIALIWVWGHSSDGHFHGKGFNKTSKLIDYNWWWLCHWHLGLA